MFFFFKQKTAYEMRISDWSSDVCSSDLLRAAHQQHPFIAVWDDHESTNNAWRDGADNHDPGEGTWPERKAISARVYDEWMPIRLPDPTEPLKIWRHLTSGELAAPVMPAPRPRGRAPQPAMFTRPPDPPDPTPPGST